MPMINTNVNASFAQGALRINERLQSVDAAVINRQAH